MNIPKKFATATETSTFAFGYGGLKFDKKSKRFEFQHISAKKTDKNFENVTKQHHLIDLSLFAIAIQNSINLKTQEPRYDFNLTDLRTFKKARFSNFFRRKNLKKVDTANGTCYLLN